MRTIFHYLRKVLDRGLRKTQWTLVKVSLKKGNQITLVLYRLDTYRDDEYDGEDYVYVGKDCRGTLYYVPDIYTDKRIKWSCETSTIIINLQRKSDGRKLHIEVPYVFRFSSKDIDNRLLSEIVAADSNKWIPLPTEPSKKIHIPGYLFDGDAIKKQTISLYFEGDKSPLNALITGTYPSEVLKAVLLFIGDENLRKTTKEHALQIKATCVREDVAPARAGAAQGGGARP